MRNTFFYILLLTFSLNSIYGQDEKSSGSKIYLRVYGNYSLPLSGSFKASNYIFNSRQGGYSSDNVTTSSNNTTAYKKNTSALGKGIHAGAGLGFVASDFINIGVDVDYYRSGRISSKYISTIYSLHKDTLIDYTGNHSFNATIISLVPNITYKAISHPNYYFYGRLGFMFGLIKKLQETTEESTSFAISSAKRTDLRSRKDDYDYKGGISLGFNTAIGIQVKLISSLRLSIEIQNNYNVYTPGSRTLTASAVNTNNKITNGLDGLKESQKTTNFVNNYTEKNVVEADKPSETPKIKIPYMSLGLSMGLAYKF